MDGFGVQRDETACSLHVLRVEGGLRDKGRQGEREGHKEVISCRLTEFMKAVT
jgi:hypothetical protein